MPHATARRPIRIAFWCLFLVVLAAQPLLAQAPLSADTQRTIRHLDFHPTSYEPRPGQFFSREDHIRRGCPIFSRSLRKGGGSELRMQTKFTAKTNQEEDHD